MADKKCIIEGNIESYVDVLSDNFKKTMDKMAEADWSNIDAGISLYRELNSRDNLAADAFLDWIDLQSEYAGHLKNAILDRLLDKTSEMISKVNAIPKPNQFFNPNEMLSPLEDVVLEQENESTPNEVPAP